MTKLPEVISTIKRRRAWSVEEKVAILEAAFSPGGSVAAAADAAGVSRSLVYIWRQQVRDGAMPGVAITDAGVSAFAPVAITTELATPPAPPPPGDKPCRDRRRSGTIEVRLVNGRSIKVDEGIEAAVLARLVAVLDSELA